MLCESISFPALGTGSVFGFPLSVMAPAFFSALEEYVMNITEIRGVNVKKVRLMLKRKETCDFFEREFIRRYSLCDLYVNETGELAVNEHGHGHLMR
jgi:O-acetyl-ADP-ribose deacetylase (regulator of RNase III)